MNHRPFVIVDIETTGASARNGKITEIGALRVENMQIVGKFERLVNPEVPIPAFITKLTGITNDMVWSAKPFHGIAQELEQLLHGSLFIAHNVNFDYGFIKEEFRRVGHTFAMDRLCSVQLSRKLYPEYKSHALDRVIERMDLQVKNRHRASDDARVVYEFIKREHETRGIELFHQMDKILVRKR